MAEIPKIVSQRLQAIATMGDHPDPNLLGAFVERSLGKRERVQVLEHLSRCTTCREIVSLSAAPPEMTHAVSGPVSRAWFSWPVLRGAALVACVMVVGAVLTLRQKHEGRQISATIAEGRPGETQLPMPNSAIEKKVPSLQIPAPVAKPVFAAKQTASRQKAITANPANGSYDAAPSSAVEMAEARTGSPFAEVPGRAKDAAAESQGSQAEKASGGALARRNMVSAAASDAPIPSNLAPRWTLSSDGTLQRSLDSGRTWQTIPVSSQTIFRALAANGLDIWVGGAAGALFHSSDAGQHWTQIKPMVNGEALEDDIIGVEFTDTLHGKLTSSIEEIWTTADAGLTWQKQ